MKETFSILVVEDELITAENIRESLTKGGYRVAGVASTGPEALGIMAVERPHLVLCDIKLKGGMDGTELAGIVAEQYDVPVIFLTAFSDKEILSRVTDSAAYGYLMKPFDERELHSNIEIAIQKHRADQAVRESETHLRQINERLHATVIGIIEAMTVVVETRDPYTAGHQRRVAELAGAIGKDMALPSETLEGMILAAAIHDIGKLGVPSELLSKPSRLNDVEFQLIKFHSRAGYDILKNIDFPWPIAEIVHQHHEKMNGSGYPRGLEGSAILIEARIIAVADVVEAIVSHRPYRPALGLKTALDELAGHRGILYDPAAVDSCLSLFDRGFTFTKSIRDTLGPSL